MIHILNLVLMFKIRSILGIHWHLNKYIIVVNCPHDPWYLGSLQRLRAWQESAADLVYWQRSAADKGLLLTTTQSLTGVCCWLGLPLTEICRWHGLRVSDNSLVSDNSCAQCVSSLDSPQPSPTGMWFTYNNWPFWMVCVMNEAGWMCE